MDSPIPNVTLYELVFIVMKRKWGIATILFFGLLGGFGWLMFIRDDGYLVGAKVLVKLGREQAPPTSVIGMPPMVLGYRQNDVNSEIDILQSTVLVERVVDHFKMDQPGPPDPVPAGLVARVRYYARKLSKMVKDWLNEQLIRVGLRERISERDTAIFMIKKGMNVISQKDSNVIVVTMTLPVRQGGGMVLNKLLDEYQQYRLEVHSDRRASPFFTERVMQAEHALSAAEKELQSLEQSADIQLLERQKELLLQQLASVDELTRGAQVVTDEAEEKLRRFEEEAKKAEPNFAAVGAFDHESFATGLLAQLAELQRERDKLRMLEVESSRRIASNRDQYRTIRDMLQANLQATATEKNAVLEKYIASGERLRTRLSDLQAQQMKWTDLRRKVQVSEETYHFYRKKLDESLAQTALEERQVSNVSVVERATDAIGPTGMRKITLVGIIVAACCLAAVLWVSVAEFFDHRVYSAAMLERILGVPTMAVTQRVARSPRGDSQTIIPASELESIVRHAASI